MTTRLLMVWLATALPNATLCAAPMVWCGFEYAFTRPDDVNGADPMYRDVITQQVALARADTRGLYNVLVEAAYANPSPAGTRWATDVTAENSGKIIAASNYEALGFASWRVAYGDSGNLADNIRGRNAVLHLINEDIYLDIRFTSWSERIGGGFAYVRAAMPASGNLSADFNLDEQVDGADLELWRSNFGESDSATRAQGDADADCDVDGDDFLIWQRALSVPASSPIEMNGESVPESTSITLAIAAAVVLITASRR